LSATLKITDAFKYFDNINAFADIFLVTMNKQVATTRNNSVRIKFNKSGYQGGQYVTEFVILVI
jgi:hypothetical protein